MKIKRIVVAIILIYALFAGVRMGAPWIRNKMFAHEMESQAGLMKFGTAVRARNVLMDTAQSYRVPINEKNLKIVKDEVKGYILIETSYQIVVTFPPFKYTYTWKFHNRAEAGLPVVKRNDFS